MAPPLKNDCFALPQGVYWTPVADALHMLESRLSVTVGDQDVSVPKALGRVLAQDIYAPRAHPPYDNSAVDGYAIVGPLADRMVKLPLAAGRAAAGAPFEGVLQKGQALRILTGAKKPEGVNAILLQEDVTKTKDGSAIKINGSVREGANIRPKGEDIQKGQRILAKAHRITAADIGMLSSLGITKVRCFEKLRVAVLSTGDELRDASGLDDGESIYDANRPMLLALLAKWGFEGIDGGIIADTSPAVRNALDSAAKSADVIITTGGASSGDEDHISKALTQNGTMALWRIAIKPGRPLALGFWQDTPIFGMPGNPVAAFVCAMIFAKPSLDMLSGAPFSKPLRLRLPAAFEKVKKAGRTEYLRAKLENGAVQVFASEGSGRISGLSWAEGLVELDDKAQTITKGDLVDYIPFAALLD